MGSMEAVSDRDRQEAFLRVFEPQRHALWRFVRSMVRTDHDAQDITSETILQAYQGFHRLRDQQAFVSFIFTIAHRLVKRHNWRRRLFGTYDEEVAHAVAHTDMLPDEQADVVMLRQALQRLPERTREAVILYEILGFSVVEIRAIQGGTASGVKSRLKRGREALARMLGAEQPEGSQRPLPTPSFTNHPVL